jgi:predicted ATPase
MRELPTGTVTFLFTDVEGSTRLLQELGDRYAQILGEHRHALRDAFTRNGGVEVDTQGDAFFFAFAKASDAIAAAATGRDALASGLIRVRMGLHTGEPLVTEEGYVGIDVHRAARIAASGHGGQILVSQSTRDLAGSASLHDLGEHRLKDLTASERIYQLGDGEFPPLKSLNQTNLPMQPTPLVGRERELREVLELLRARRFVTLTGPGGSGKTRLALQAAAEVIEDYPDGVWFVSLAAVRDPRLIEPTVGRLVGAPDGLVEFLRDKKLLLLLDNLEQLLPDAGPIVASLGVHVLATSRERLRVSAEHEYPVETLPLDDAVMLFAQRARQLKPRFEPDAHVAEIAGRLDGLPLALELAAARVKVLTTEQILERLGHGLLTGGGLDVPERQRTLRATIEWSYQLLDAEEQQLFRRLAVFEASFDLEAAEEICEADLDRLQSLCEKSLVRQSEMEGRFFILETIREFAVEQLISAGDAERLSQRHADHFLARAESAVKPGRFAVDAAVYERLDREIANFRAASKWMLQAGEADGALGLGTALVSLWLTRSHFHDARTWLENAPLEDRSVAADARAAALYTAGLIALFVLDDAERAEPLWQAALEIFQDLGDSERVAAVLNRLGNVAQQRGNLQEALDLHKEALRLCEHIRDRSGELNTLHLMGEIYRDLGEYDEGERYLERAATHARALGDFQHLANTLHSIGDLALDRGDYERALAVYSESLRMHVELEALRQQVYCVAGIGSTLAELGHSNLAARLWGSVEAQEKEMGFRILGAERPRYEQRIAAAREQLGPSQFEEAYREGVTLGPEAAVYAALAAVGKPSSLAVTPRDPRA